MDFSFSKEQQMIRGAAREFLKKECPVDLVREMEENDKGYSPELWLKIAELGWLGIIFPSEYGGTDGTFTDLVILLEEIGRHLAPVPFLPTIIFGGLPILYAGTNEQKEEFLPRIAKGDIILSIALTELDPCYDHTGIKIKAIRDGNGFLIDGIKLFVPYAHVADYLVCATRTQESKKEEGGITLFLIERDNPAISCTLLKTLACDKLCEVVFKGATFSKDNMLGEYGEGWGIIKTILKYAVIGQCALMVGGAERVLEMTVAHAKKRVQFDRPIGSFQAVQHKCADMKVYLDGAKFATYQAACKLDKGLECSLEVSVAKAWVNQAYNKICTHGHQIHGGIGVTKEYEMELYSRRAKASEFLWGDTDHHREVVAQQLSL